MALVNAPLDEKQLQPAIRHADGENQAAVLCRIGETHVDLARLWARPNSETLRGGICTLAIRVGNRYPRLADRSEYVAQNAGSARR